MRLQLFWSDCIPCFLLLSFSLIRRWQLLSTYTVGYFHRYFYNYNKRIFSVNLLFSLYIREEYTTLFLSTFSSYSLTVAHVLVPTMVCPYVRISSWSWDKVLSHRYRVNSVWANASSSKLVGKFVSPNIILVQNECMVATSNKVVYSRHCLVNLYQPKCILSML